MLDTLLWMKVLEGDKKNEEEASWGGLLFLVPIIIIALAVASLPALLYWQYRNQHKGALAFTVLMSIAMFGALYPYTRNSWWETFIYLEVCASLVGVIAYLHVLVCKRLNKRIAKDAAASLSTGSWVTWALLTLGTLVLSYLIAFGIFGVQGLSDALYSLLHFAFFGVGLTRYHFYDVFHSYIEWAVALSPTALVSTVLYALFRRHASHGQSAAPLSSSRSAESLP